jgi:hypothetical protein
MTDSGQNDRLELQKDDELIVILLLYRVNAPAGNISKITMVRLLIPAPRSKGYFFFQLTEELFKQKQLLFVIEFVYILTQWLIKMSFLTFYLRVLSSTPTYRLMVFGAMGFTAAQTVAVWLFYGLQCIPLGTFFNPSAYPEGHCVATTLTLYIPASLVSGTLSNMWLYLPQTC